MTYRKSNHYFDLWWKQNNLPKMDLIDEFWHYSIEWFNHVSVQHFGHFSMDSIPAMKPARRNFTFLMHGSGIGLRHLFLTGYSETSDSKSVWRITNYPKFRVLEALPKRRTQDRHPAGSHVMHWNKSTILWTTTHRPIWSYPGRANFP